MGIFVGLIDWAGGNEAERRHRSEATKLSGARMPEQRLALLGHSRSTQLFRFPPEAPLSVLASPAIAQPTINPIEKLCSALNFCWPQKKRRPFSNGKTHTLQSWLRRLLEAACPSVSPDVLLAVQRHASSRLRAVCCFFNPCRWPAASLCCWLSVQTFSL